MYPSTPMNQQDQWVAPAAPLVNAAQGNHQHARTVNNSCEYQTFNSAFQPSNNAAIASKNFSQPYQQTNNFQLSSTPYQVYSPPQREGLTSNMCPPQVTLPNNQFASPNSQSTNQCFQSTSEMHDGRSYGNMYTNWSNPASHCTTSTPRFYKQATINQPLVPVTAQKQQSFHNQIQDITQQDIPQLYNGLNHKMANFMSGKDDRNAISSQLSGQFVSCNIPQAQQNPYQCRMSAGSNANKESRSSYSSLQCTSDILAFLVKANTVPTNQAVAQQDPSSTVGSNTFADYLSQPPKYTGLHHMVKQSVSQTDVTMFHSKRPMLNSTGPANYFKNSSNSSSVHRENISLKCTKKGISSHGSGNILVAQADTGAETKHQREFRIQASKLLRLLKQPTPLEIPSQTQLPSINNSDRQRLTKPLTCAEGNDCSVQASPVHLGMKAVAVVPPLSQESSENVSEKTSPNKTSEYYEEQEKNISQPDAEVCNISGSSQSDSSSTPKSDDSTAFSPLKQILEFNQNDFSPTQMNVAPEEPVSQNIAQHQSSCQNDTATASTFQHDPPLVETHDSNMSCPVEAQSKQENPTEMIILKEGEEYSETPYKSSWLNVNEQLDDIDKECGFPWAMRCRPHQERTNEGSTVAESPNHVSKTQLDTDELMKQIEDSMSELLASPAPVLFESEVDESCYDFKIEVLPPELAKQIHEQTCREGTLEPNVCVDNYVSSSELKLHDGTESLSESVTVLSTPETESGLPLSEDSIKIPHHPSVETENSMTSEEETDDTMRSNSSDMDNNVMETNGETEDGERTKNSLSEHSDSKEDYAQPLQLNRFDIPRKYEKTYQEVKPHHPSVETQNLTKGEMETDDHPMRSNSPDMDEMDESLMEANRETEDGDRTENSSSENSDSEEDCPKPLRLNSFDIKRTSEKTFQGMKPFTMYAKKNKLFDVFQRKGKLIIKRKNAHSQKKYKTSKQSNHHVFQMKKQKKITDTLKRKTSAADTPSTAEIADKVLQERKPDDGQIEKLEDTVNEAPTSREENACDQMTELQKTLYLFLEEEYEGPLPVKGVENQIECEETNLNSNDRDIQQAVLNCKDGVKADKVLLDKVDNLTSQGECQTVDRQYNKIEDHDSRNISDKHSSPVEVVSSQQEEKDDFLSKFNKVLDDLKSSISEEGADEAIADPQIPVSNPEEESLGSLQSDVLDTQTQSKITIQDPHNKGVKVDKVLVDKVCPLNTTGCQIIEGKRKSQSGEDEEAFPCAKEKDQPVEDLQLRKSIDNVSKRERLFAGPPSKLVKLSLYGKSQMRDPNANQTSLKLPKDLFIHLSPREKSLSETVCTENYSIKKQIWEKWRESFVPTIPGLKGKCRSPVKFSSGEKLKIKKPLSSQMHSSIKQKHCLSLKKRWLHKLEEKERKTGVSSKLSPDLNRSDAERTIHHPAKETMCTIQPSSFGD